MDQPTIELIDPTEMHPLPNIKNFPRFNKESAEFFGFREDVRANGIKDPLRITRAKCVVDGELRRLAAVSLRIQRVPCITVPDEEVHTTILRGLVWRRNLTKGQRAYLAVPELKSVLDEGEMRRHKNLRKGQQIPEADSVGFGKTVALLAQELGFSKDLLEQAQWLHKEFAKDASLQSEWEPKILDLEDPIGLGAAKAGIAGEDVDQSNRDLGALRNAFSGFKKTRVFWEKLSTVERQQIKDQWETEVADLPATMRKAMKEVL